jgi:outer membrane receptor for ferrienterochelin and colicins
MALACISSFALSSEVIETDTIKVSTTSLGQEQSIDDVHSSIEVIDEKFIQNTSARSLPQVLNQAIGLEVKDAGSTSSVSMRGFNSSHTLILVDGLRVSGKYGSSDLASISLDNVERIEIVRGPMSALYGADALSGVVNIITKKNGLKDSLKGTFLMGQAQNGQRDTSIAKLHGATVGETMTHNYSIELREKDEYRYEKSSVDTDLKNESRQFLSYANTFNTNDSNQLTSKIDYARQNDDGVNFANSKIYEKENRYHGALIHNYTSSNYLLDTNFGYSYSDAKVNRGSGLETTDYKQAELNSYFRHFTTDSMTNIIGVGTKSEDIEVSMYQKSASRDNYNLLFQNDYELIENLTSSIGVRYDDFSDFGSSTNPKASLVYKYDDFKFRTSYGEAFQAPSFTNMYSHFTRSAGPVTHDISGNENLKPEESKTHEYAIGYKKENFGFDVIHHRSKLDNLIESYVTNYAFPISYTSYRNIDKSSINGTEVSLKYDFNNGFKTNISWEHLETKDESTQDKLTGSANVTLKTNFSYEIGQFRTSLNIKKYNDYYGSDENRNNVNSDYTVADIKFNYQFSDNIEWFVGVDNVQDKIMPYNMTSRGTPNDPGERFYYTGMNVTF